MTPRRPTPDSSHPFTRSEVAVFADTTPAVVKSLAKGFLKKRGQGTGNFLGFSMDDAVRIRVAKELLHVGVQVTAIHSLFQSIEKDWPRLRRRETLVTGASLVLIVGPLGPNRAGQGQAYLTTAEEGVQWLRQSKRTVVVIDVGEIINDIERKTGQRYFDDDVDSGGPENRQ
jgi:hypothetical protein